MNMILNRGTNRFYLGDLMLLGHRVNNAKRNFLFISKLLGKHLEIEPDVLMATGFLLAFEYAEKNKADFLEKDKNSKYFDLKEKCINFIESEDYRKNYISTNDESLSESLSKLPKMDANDVLFIGFAETATGIAMATAYFFKNAHYISTTREDLFDEKILFSFEEEHSHATTHQCFTSSGNKKINTFKEIVFIDDELTTGKSMLNLTKELIDLTNIKKFSMLTILDLRDELNISNKETFESENEVIVDVLSLFAAAMENDDFSVYNNTEDQKITVDENSDRLLTHYYPYFSRLNSFDNSEYEFIKESGRLLMKTEDIRCIDEMSKLVAHQFARNCSSKIKNILVLGHGENIYIPSKIASNIKLELMRHSAENICVNFKTTTRSPIFVDEKIIKSQHEFTDIYENTYYLYNKEQIEKDYDLVLFVSESNCASNQLEVPKLTNNMEVLKITKEFNDYVE